MTGTNNEMMCRKKRLRIGQEEMRRCISCCEHRCRRCRHVSVVKSSLLCLLLLLCLSCRSVVSSTSSSASSSSSPSLPHTLPSPSNKLSIQSSNATISTSTSTPTAVDDSASDNSNRNNNDNDNNTVHRPTVLDNSVAHKTKYRKLKPKQPKTAAAAAASSSSSSSSKKNKQKNKNKRQWTTAQTASLRRLQQEWKEAVLTGVAFDWARGEPVVVSVAAVAPRRKTKRSSKRDAIAASVSSSSSSSSLVNNNNANTTTNATTTTATTTKSSHVWIGPLNQRNLFVWHFTVCGLPGSVYEQGVYHGRIVLPHNYPDQPPRVQMWTKSGRFKPHHNICLSASHYHPETWNPSQWSCRTIVESLRLHMCTPANEIGGCNDSHEQRLRYAQASRTYQYHIPTTTTTAISSRKWIVVDHARMIERGYIEPVFVSRHDDDKDKLPRDDKTNVVEETKAADLMTTKASSLDLSSGVDTLLHQEDIRHSSKTDNAPIKRKRPRSKNHKDKRKQTKKRKQALLASSATTVTMPTTRTAPNKRSPKQQQLWQQQQQQPWQKQQIISVSTVSSHLAQILRKKLLCIGLLAFVLLFCFLNRDLAIALV